MLKADSEESSIQERLIEHRRNEGTIERVRSVLASEGSDLIYAYNYEKVVESITEGIAEIVRRTFTVKTEKPDLIELSKPSGMYWRA